MTPASATLELRFEPITGARRRRRVIGNVLIVLIGVVTGIDGSDLPPLTEMVIARREPAEELVRGDAPGAIRPWLRDVVTKDLQRLGEEAFLERWGRPADWERLFRTWTPGGPARRGMIDGR